jgi:hypothetical protein
MGMARWISLATLRCVKEIKIVLIFVFIEAADRIVIVIVIRELESTVVDLVHPNFMRCFFGRGILGEFLSS